jgi:tartrate dehydratase alpha subunit/fumarate hydratase class I-like protein
MKSLGTAACPPYHIAFVVGGLSADQALKVAKLASTKYYDNLPTSGNELGQAFRDTALEATLLNASREFGIGAQFGGKYFAHDIRVIRLPRTAVPALSPWHSPAPPTAISKRKSTNTVSGWRSWNITREIYPGGQP